MAKYRVSVHTGPLRSEAAGELVDKIRANQWLVKVWGVSSGTEHLYLKVEAESRTGATMLARELLLTTFGANTGLVHALGIQEVSS